MRFRLLFLKAIANTERLYYSVRNTLKYYFTNKPVTIIQYPNTENNLIDFSLGFIKPCLIPYLSIESLISLINVSKLYQKTLSADNIFNTVFSNNYPIAAELYEIMKSHLPYPNIRNYCISITRNVSEPSKFNLQVNYISKENQLRNNTLKPLDEYFKRRKLAKNYSQKKLREWDDSNDAWFSLCIEYLQLSDYYCKYNDEKYTLFCINTFIELIRALDIAQNFDLQIRNKENFSGKKDKVLRLYLKVLKRCSKSNSEQILKDESLFELVRLVSVDTIALLGKMIIPVNKAAHEARIQSLIAQTYEFKDKNLIKAAECYKESYKLCPSLRTVYYYNCLQFYRDNGMNQEALEFLQSSIANFITQNDLCHYYATVGLIHRRLFQYEESITNLCLALKYVDVSTSTIYIELNIVRALVCLNRGDESIEILTRLEADNPDMDIALKLVVLDEKQFTYLGLLKFDESFAIIHQMNEIKQSVQHYILMLECYFLMDQYRKSINLEECDNIMQTLKSFHINDYDQWTIKRFKANIASKRFEHKEAVEYYTDVINSVQSDETTSDNGKISKFNQGFYSTVLCERGIEYELLKQYDLALKDYIEAISVNVEKITGNTYYYLAKFYASEGYREYLKNKGENTENLRDLAKKQIENCLKIYNRSYDPWNHRVEAQQLYDQLFLM